MRRSLPFTSVLAVIAASACATPAPPPVTKAPSEAATTKPAEASVTGKVPEELLAKIRADLVQQAGAEAASAARLMSAEEVMWPNGSLGCPQPGRMYTQAIVPGYRVQFEAAGRTYSYHATQKGTFFLCKRPLSGDPPGGPVTR